MKRSMGTMGFLVASLAAAATASAQDASSWNLGGTLSSRPSALFTEGKGLQAPSYGSTTTLDLDLRVSGDRSRGEASAETAVLTGSAAENAWAASAGPLVPKDELLIPSDPASDARLVAFRLRTLYLKLTPSWGTLAAGRQVINYGRGALWSPTDIFTVLDISGLSPLRRGTDSLSVGIPIGDAAGIDAVAAPSENAENGRYLVRSHALIGDIDGALCAARDGAGEGWILGADFKTDLVLGLYGDAAYEILDSGGGKLRAAGGADWSFGDFIVAAEYYYNAGGSALDPLFPSAHNLYGNITWKATELLSIAGTTIWAPSESSINATLLTSFSATQNVDIGAYLRTLFEEDAADSLEAGFDIELKF